MKNNKRFTLFFITGLMLFSIQSCSKFDDNDNISLKTRKERVANVWKVENYKLNDVDLTSLFSGYTETFTKESAYSYQWGIIGGTGTWEFQNNDEEIRITGINNQTSTTLVIQKLEESQFWYYYMDGDNKKEFHMIEQ